MIYLKTDQEISKIEKAGKIVANALKEIRSMVSPGLSLLEIEKFADNYPKQFGGRAAFKGYHNFPAAICLSVNDVVVHGIPDSYVLRSGDIVGIDYGVELDGYYGDSAITVPVGEISSEAVVLIDATKTALELGIAKALMGGRLGDISHAIQEYAESKNFSVVRNYVGHGIGRKLHEEPPVPNYGHKGKGVKLEPGMVLALEPMVNAGTYETILLPDGWTASTKDGCLSAHFEHTIAITRSGPRILTLPDN